MVPNREISSGIGSLNGSLRSFCRRGDFRMTVHWDDGLYRIAVPKICANCATDLPNLAYLAHLPIQKSVAYIIFRIYILDSRGTGIKYVIP